MSVEIEPLDRLSDLVAELLDEGESPTDIRDTVVDAIDFWKATIREQLAKRAALRARGEE